MARPFGIGRLAAGAALWLGFASPRLAAAETHLDFQASLAWAPVHRLVEGAPRRDEAESGALGVAFFLRSGWFQGGPVLTLALSGDDGLAGDESAYLGVAAGYTRALGANWSLAFLGEGGAHWVDYVADERARGASGLPHLQEEVVLPYAGARCGVMWREEQKALRPLSFHELGVGLSLFARADLRRGTATVDYSDLACLGGCGAETVHYRVGGWTAGLALEIAMGW